MRGSKAKAIRKVVYEKKDFRYRDYTTSNRGITINTGDCITFELPDKSKHSLALRRVYRRLKPRLRYIPNKILKKVILGK